MTVTEKLRDIHDQVEDANRAWCAELAELERDAVEGWDGPDPSDWS